MKEKQLTKRTGGLRLACRAIGLLALIITTSNVHAQFSGGNGTPESPYEITSADQLDEVRNNRQKHFRLMNDIDLTNYLKEDGQGYAQWGTKGWKPIGEFGQDFSGTFDGAGYTISGLWIERPEEEVVGVNPVGLFGVILRGTILNLTVEIDPGKAVSGHGDTGGLAGKITGTASAPASLSGCRVSGTVKGINGSIGGLAGNIGNYTSITDCHASCTVTGDDKSLYNNVGGLTGDLYGEGISLLRCSAEGTVSGKGRAGGLIGDIYGDTDSWITITDCFATATATGIDEVGGLTGYAANVTFSGCYATGMVTSNMVSGGLVGHIFRNTTFENCFFDTNATGQEHALGKNVTNELDLNPTGTAGMTTAEMKQQETYSDNGWDFSDTWQIKENSTYPYHKHLITLPGNPVNYTITDPTPSSGRVADGESFTFKIQLAEGYTQSNPSVTAGSESLSLDQGSYTLSDITQSYVIAITGVDKNTYTITLPTNPTGYTITNPNPANGKVTHGESFTFKVQVAEGYTDSTPKVSASIKNLNDFKDLKDVNGLYTLSSITNDMEIKVENVVKNTYTITLPTNPTGYTITNPNPANSKVIHGNNFTFKVALAEGYTDSTPKVSASIKDLNDFKDLEAVNGLYTLSSITNDMEIKVENVVKNTYTITLPTNPTGYTITNPNPANGKVTHGESFTFKVQLAEGYTDSTPVVKAGTQTLTANNQGLYTLSNITANMEIKVENVVKNTYPIELPAKEDQEGYTIDIISPAGGVYSHGDELKFTIDLDEAHDQVVPTVTINGQPVEPDENGVYTHIIAGEVEIEVDGITLNTYLVVLPKMTGIRYRVESSLMQYLRADQVIEEGIFDVPHGTTFRFGIVKLSGYTQADPVIESNGKVITPDGDGFYNLTVTATIDIHLSGVKLNTYTVNLPAYQGIRYDRLAGDYTLSHGSTFTFSITKGGAYSRSALKVTATNGHEVRLINSLTNTYQITVKGETEILVEGIELNVYTVTIESTGGSIMFPVAGEYKVGIWDDFRFTLRLLNEYSNSTPIVKVDGEELPYESYKDLMGGEYTYYIKSVTDDLYVTIEGVERNVTSSPELTPQPPKGGAKVWTTPGQIQVTIDTPPSGGRGVHEVRIYTVAGQLVATQPFSLLRTPFSCKVPSGTYIVVVGEETFKVVVK